MPARATLLVLCVLSSGATSGCYLMQSAEGELAVLAKRRPIATVVADPHTAPALRRELQEVTQIRDFASHDLGLPDNGSYRTYADIGRPYVVWTVVAAGELSIEPRRWCYPIVGCVAYRGYFVETRAKRFADRLEQQGLDVDLDGVAAFSTLGHFNDPILNTMAGWGDIELASIIFHELTHQMIYVPDDADFNEALAVTVQEEGVRRWLRSQGREADLARHELEERHTLDVTTLLRSTQASLGALYASAASPTQMRAQKNILFSKLKASYAVLTTGWEKPAPFDSWFAADLNNAYLASVATYYDCVPGFERELQAAGGDLRAFYMRVRALAKLDSHERDALVCRQITQ